MTRKRGQVFDGEQWASGRRLLAACLSVCLLVGPGWGAHSRPHNPKDARYVLDIMPLARWIYEDETLPLRVDFGCRSIEARTAMEVAPGDYVVHYQAVREKGGTPTVHRDTRQLTGGSGFQYSPKLESMTLSPGKYDLLVSMTVPSGKVVPGSFTRHIEVRKREMRLILNADRPAYKPGDTITLTGKVENISDGDIDFKAMQTPEVLLRDQSGDTLRVEDVRLPDTLKRGDAFGLFTLRFTAGKADNRFTAGVRREWGPVPFGRRGEYKLRLTMKVLTGEVVKPRWRSHVRPWMEASPATAVLRIAKAGDP